MPEHEKGPNFPSYLEHKSRHLKVSGVSFYREPSAWVATSANWGNSDLTM